MYISPTFFRTKVCWLTVLILRYFPILQTALNNTSNSLHSTILLSVSAIYLYCKMQAPSLHHLRVVGLGPHRVPIPYRGIAKRGIGRQYNCPIWP